MLSPKPPYANFSINSKISNYFENFELFRIFRTFLKISNYFENFELFRIIRTFSNISNFDQYMFKTYRIYIQYMKVIFP
jgi:hypothetical protein